MGSTGKPISEATASPPRSRHFAQSDLRKTLFAFLSGAIGIVCATSAAHGVLRETEVAPVKNVKVTRSLR